MSVVARAIRHTDGAMFGENRPLLVWRKLREPAAAAQKDTRRPTASPD
jgi:hypothetical protein